MEGLLTRLAVAEEDATRKGDRQLFVTLRAASSELKTVALEATRLVDGLTTKLQSEDAIPLGELLDDLRAIRQLVKDYRP